MFVWGWRRLHFQEEDLRFLPWLLSQAILGPEPSHATLTSVSQTFKVAFIISTLQMRKMRLQAVRQLSLGPGVRSGIAGV